LTESWRKREKEREKDERAKKRVSECSRARRRRRRRRRSRWCMVEWRMKGRQRGMVRGEGGRNVNRNKENDKVEK